jgi:hypothetical protein
MNLAYNNQHEINVSYGENNSSLNGDTSKNDDSINKNDENKSNFNTDQENKQNFPNAFNNFYPRNNFNPQAGHFQHQNMHHHHHGHNFTEKYTPLPPSEVTCFKCGEKGHYANKCNKGVFAFLRNSENK